jgi:glycine/D-amino acid oxidase-like deaminating enzyme
MPTERVNLAVVGGGIVGAWAAYLAQRAKPDRRVALLERGLVGCGTSLYGGAIRLPFGSSPLRRAMAARAERLYRNLGGPSAADLPGRPLDLYWVVEDGTAEALREGCVGRGPVAAGSAEVARLTRGLPFLQLPERAAVLRDRAAAGSPGATAARLAECVCGSLGGSCQEGVEVAAVQEDLSGCLLSLSDGRTLRADAVLSATGPWPAPVGAGMPRALRIKKVTALHVDWPVRSDDPVVFFADRDAYLLPDRDAGRWIFSFASATWDVRPDPAELALCPAERRQAEGILADVAPPLVGRVVGARTFCDGYADDADPVTGLQPGSRRRSVARGGAGSGYRLAPAMAERALEAIAEKIP